jgi:hypothetical protein
VSNLSTVVDVEFPESLHVCSLPASGVFVEVDYLTSVGIPDSLCCERVSHSCICLISFLSPDHFGWVGSLVGLVSRVCTCVVKFEPQARSGVFVGAHPNSVAVISLVPPHSIGSL